jgi:putative endopeptidase
MKLTDKFFTSFLVLMVVSLVSMMVSQDSLQTQSDAHGIQVANIDRSVKPGDNFYLYANGDWIKKTEIPNDRYYVGVFSILDDLANKRTADLIQEAAKANAASGSPQRKIADLYNSYMDEKAIEAKGLAPIKPHLDKIAAIRDKKELAFALGASMRADVDALNNTNFHTPNLFGLWAAPDFNDSAHYTAYLLQGGLQLPDREYYVSNSEQMKKTREEYQKHVLAILKLAGFSDTDARTSRIVELEHEIAEKHTSLADDQDIHKANNPWNQSDFKIKAPGLDWNEFFRGADLAERKEFIVWPDDCIYRHAQLLSKG